MLQRDVCGKRKVKTAGDKIRMNLEVLNPVFITSPRLDFSKLNVIGST